LVFPRQVRVAGLALRECSHPSSRKLRELVRLARKHGYRKEELIKIIKSVD
jgi:hypothetical protein